MIWGILSIDRQRRRRTTVRDKTREGVSKTRIRSNKQIFFELVERTPLADKFRRSRRGPPHPIFDAKSIFTHVNCQTEQFSPVWSPSTPSLALRAVLPLTVLFIPLAWGPDLGRFIHLSFPWPILRFAQSGALDGFDRV